ncbi:MAG: phosphoadenosine phosphosulfate reductase family protein [Desulfurococcales archaeon]|nr:phosphoadenosine phosphosulfate reductase family protein [Desulfurococcales archaeon]
MKPKTIGWNIEKNAPWLGVPKGFKLNRDHWIAGNREIEWVKQALDSLFPGAGGLAAKTLILFHKAFAPSGGFGVEVYMHAARIGLLAYEKQRWRLYPTGALASLLESLGYTTTTLRLRGRLKGKKIKLNECPVEAYDYILVSSGRFVGPAKIIEREHCIVKVKDMAPRGFKPLPASSIDDAALVNRAYIERLASEAREFIRKWATHRPVYVAVSGGLDSSVTLSLAVEALGADNIIAVYADTGMEFNESLETVERLASKLGVQLEIVPSGLDPIVEIRRRGLMGKDKRWCTRILKLTPLRKFYRKMNAKIVIDGARSFESESRASTPRVGVNPVIPFVKRILPIHSWSRLEVQLYARLRGLPMNPLYNEGLHRIGCILCPAMHIHEMEVAMELKPTFYQRIYGVLRELGVDEPRSFLLDGSWRKKGVSATR